MKYGSLVLCWLAIGLGAGVANADIYSFVDVAGVTHYTNVPSDPRYEFLLATPAERTQSGEAFNAVLLAKSAQFDPIIENAASAAALEPALLRAVIVVESGFNARALSKRGAAGLMQLMPETARRYGASDRFDPKQNIHAGARYLKTLIKRYDNDIQLALAAYNAGEDAVDRCGRCIPHYRETQAYVPKVWRVYQTLLGQAAAT
ncbi:MAG: lytic transglycosylase domain-containing protein [Steroidobacterales bacterium]